jgi:hypothetical protein
MLTQDKNKNKNKYTYNKINILQKYQEIMLYMWQQIQQSQPHSYYQFGSNLHEFTNYG